MSRTRPPRREPSPLSGPQLVRLCLGVAAVVGPGVFGLLRLKGVPAEESALVGGLGALATFAYSLLLWR